uniref:Calmodulin regulated spectrin associated protein family member 2 n=1 Tax=Tetraodon nigroviridis TaxID=99883 RepID=H3C0Y9_TETNG
MGDAADDGAVRRTFLVPAIRSFDHYDFTRAKVSCSLTWLVAKAFGSDAVPEELAEPLYRDQYNQEHLKPTVASLLQSAELYCRAGSLILRSDAVKPLLGHNAVIQALAQKGLYVTDQDRLVTERDLTSMPIHMSSHLALIDTLMMAYTVELMKCTLGAVSCCSPSHRGLFTEADTLRRGKPKTQPNSSELYLLTFPRSGHSPSNKNQARYRKEHGQQRSAPSLPLVENLLKDNTDGCALTTLLHFYCSTVIRLDDICLKETMSLADSLYNLQLVQEFCKNNLNHCCHFTLEDMLYAHASIKSNYLVFMAELFWWFEVVKPSFVQPRILDTNGTGQLFRQISTCNQVSSGKKMAPVSSPVKQKQTERPGSPGSVCAEAGVMKRSTSLSFVDGCIGTWPKEKRSTARGISFEIPLDGERMVPSCEAPSLSSMTRSASSDSLGFKPGGASGATPPPYTPSTPPSIEEALKIIHDTERPHASLDMGGGEGFFLHGAEPLEPPGAHGEGDDAGSAKTHLNDHEPNSVSTDEVDTGIHSSPCPSSAPTLPRSHTMSPASSSASSGSGLVRMTSFAEQKFRKLEGRSSGGTTSPKSKWHPSHLLASEMIQLRMKLEEKRRAIEAQKKKVEAAFTRHRQKMGRTAFLNVVRRKGINAPISPSSGGAETPSTQPVTPSVETSQGGVERAERCKPDGAAPKSPSEDRGDYTRSIERLNTSLGFLQTEMQRLAQQQEKIMAMRVIPAPAPSPHRYVTCLPQAAPRGSPHAPNRSPAGIKRRPASFHARTPRTPRPNDLKVTPFSRMLNPPTSVDSLPRLRRFTSSQSQLSSFAYLGHEESRVKAENQDRRDLVEVPLSGLKPPEGPSSGQEMEGEEDGDDQKMCCGFFFKDDVKGEEDMAAKKAALRSTVVLRSTLSGLKESWFVPKLNLSLCSRLKAEEEQQKKEEEKARREYIRNEYLRKKQLKLMEDMEEVIKPRSGSLKKKPRPKSIHRDVADSPTPLVRAAGVRPRGYSVSSVSLASLNLADNDKDLPNNRKNNRPDSAGGFSSCPSTGSRNGEKDWENDSTTSSTPSNTEYTGPKLYKEPSAKSNKHIIQNALAHCCLAGKVNEGQKNKILDEMEKSEANNFLVLFRDAGCQFRSVYTYCPETEEITRLAGIGPKSIKIKMIEGLYKYNSDRKQFSQIPAKTMSASVDAITIASHLWQTKKQWTPKK